MGFSLSCTLIRKEWNQVTKICSKIVFFQKQRLRLRLIVFYFAGGINWIHAGMQRLAVGIHWLAAGIQRLAVGLQMFAVGLQWLAVEIH
ncbi:MAG TPA: hypothetical protein DIT07_04010 [Sphingobacteriaceae bacterium]|nr:hypothetical protein [Sphingobacteriaceae bacterium]